MGGHADGLEGLGLNGLADGHDDVIAGDALGRAVGLHRGGAAVPSVGADMLGLGPQGGHFALLVRLNAAGGLQGQNLAALADGLLDLLRQGGHVLNAAAVHTGHAGRAQALGGAGGVHGDVAAADDADPLARKVRRVALADAAQHLHGAEHAHGAFALNAELFIAGSADGQIHRVVLLLNVGHGYVLPDGHAGAHLHPGGENEVDVPIQHVLGQAIVRNAVPKHTAQLGQFVVYGDRVSHQGKVIGRGQAAGAAADDGDLLAGGLGPLGRLHGGRVIHRIPLQAADVHGVVHHAAAAVVLTGVLAHIGAGEGEGVVLADEAHGVIVAAGPHQ